MILIILDIFSFDISISTFRFISFFDIFCNRFDIYANSLNKDFNFWTEKLLKHSFWIKLQHNFNIYMFFCSIVQVII
jgi:hypothetical protein